MTDPYQVVAITRHDGWVVLSAHPTKDERDRAVKHEREQFGSNGSEDVLEIVGVEVGHIPTGRPQAEADQMYQAFTQEALL